MKFRRLISVAVAIQFAMAAFAQNHIVIGAESKVFETPMAKDEYAATNADDQQVVLQPGMAFAAKEEKGGWYVIEYSPGLRGMVTQNVVADKSQLKAPVSGTYKLANQQGVSVRVDNDGGKWTLTSGDKKYNGVADSVSVIFLDDAGNQMYSLTSLSGKPLLFTYDNAVTKFF